MSTETNVRRITLPSPDALLELLDHAARLRSASGSRPCPSEEIHFRELADNIENLIILHCRNYAKVYGLHTILTEVIQLCLNPE